MKEIKYKHKTEKAALYIQSETVEGAEPLLKKIVANREDWGISIVKEIGKGLLSGLMDG